MKLQARRGSHLPVLIKLVNSTTGPILEMGCGLFSTVYLFWACVPDKRRLVTYDDNPNFFEWLQDFKNPKNFCDHGFHEINLVKDWDKVDLSEPWSIAFVDHSPDNRRPQDIERLAHAEYVVVHDAEPKEDRKRRRAGYRTIASAADKFKYLYKYTDAMPNTWVLSNKHDLSTFHTGRMQPTPPKVERIVPETEMIKTHPGGHRRYTICRALREIFVKTNDPEIRLKLRYACTLAEYITSKVDRHDPGWLKAFYPFRRDFDAIMGSSLVDKQTPVRLKLKDIATDSYLRECADIPGNRKHYPICVALGQIYTKVEDDEVKFKLRYALTLAQRITDRLETVDPGWLRSFYLRYFEFEELKKEALG